MKEQEESQGSYVRWQAVTIAQLGYALNLILGITVAVLGFQMQMLLDQHGGLWCWERYTLMLSQGTLLISGGFGVACVLNSELASVL